MRRRPQWNRGTPTAGAEAYDSRAEAVGSYTGRFPACLGDNGDMWRPGDYVPACVIEPGEDAPEPPSPLEVAMSAWHSAAVTVAPSVTVAPEVHDYTLVGRPTIIASDDYAPPGAIDSNARPITWSFGSIEFRATAQHRFAWDDDGGAGDTGCRPMVASTSRATRPVCMPIPSRLSMSTPRRVVATW